MSADHCDACPFAGCPTCKYPGGPDPDLLTLKEDDMEAARHWKAKAVEMEADRDRHAEAARELAAQRDYLSDEVYSLRAKVLRVRKLGLEWQRDGKPYSSSLAGYDVLEAIAGEGDDSQCVATHPTKSERCMRLAGHVDYAPLHWPDTEGREWSVES